MLDSMGDMPAIPPEERRRIMQAACVRIRNGETLKQAAEAEGVTRMSLWDWSTADPQLADMYARARADSAYAYDDEALEVARLSTPETAASDRVLIDTLKWAAAKRRPREYGDRQTVEHTGTVGHLHLDALRAPRATASAKLIPDTDLPRLSPPIEAVEGQGISDIDEAPPSL